MQVVIGVSNRHVHLNQDDFDVLFGDTKVENLKDLLQPGQYVSNLKVSIKTEKNKFENVRVVMPVRSYTQVEISKTDSYYLGIDPPIRTSGDLEGAEVVTIEGPMGVVTKHCAIIAERHIHINPVDREKYGLKEKNQVSIRIGKEKSAILHNVFLKESPDGVLECHLDTDDANANFVKTQDIADIIID